MGTTRTTFGQHVPPVRHPTLFLLLLLLLTSALDAAADSAGWGFSSPSSSPSSSSSRRRRTWMNGGHYLYRRGGATTTTTTTISTTTTTATATVKARRPTAPPPPPNDGPDADAYSLLALALRKRFAEDENLDPPPNAKSISRAMSSLASSQSAFKGLDGAAYEAYHRTHAASDDGVDIAVSGRAQRSAERAAATADGLGACELCELVESPELLCDDDDDDNDNEDDGLRSPNGTLAGRKVLLNVTGGGELQLGGVTNLSLLVLYEPLYSGGAGIFHGGIDDPTRTRPHGGDGGGRDNRGRILVILGDGARQKLDRTLDVLDEPVAHVRLNRGLLATEAASVQPTLYRAAGAVLEILEGTLRSHNSSAVHFVGRSLAGGVASLSAIILDGGLSMPRNKKKKKKGRQKKKTTSDSEDAPGVNATGSAEGNATVALLSGFGRGRSSAVTLGAPPCVSPNVPAAFVTSILYGDDVVCRASGDSLDRLSRRVRGALTGNVLGRQIHKWRDAFSLAASGLRSHAHGSEGEEARLAVPGRAFLVRPRRLGGVCSMHQVGGQLKGGREALRAALLWQLDDVLLSKSLWRHHQLDSYIHGLDRVRLRGLDETDRDNEGVDGDVLAVT